MNQKVVLVGDCCVGKSSLIVRFTQDTWSPELSPSLGLDFKSKEMTVLDRTITFRLWDSAGQEKFKQLSSGYYRGANAIILIYDVSNRESLNNVKSWLYEVDRFCNHQVKIILVGNKSDLLHERVISYKEGLDYAEKLAIPFFEVSAKTGDNVNEIFETLARDLVLTSIMTFPSRKNDPKKKNKLLSRVFKKLKH